MPTSPLSPFPATDRFKPLTLIGQGYGGLVYRVFDTETATEVALKTVATRDPEQLYRLKQEFRRLADIRHENLVELYELFADSAGCFFTMEFIDGVDFVEHFGRASSTAPRGDEWIRRLATGVRQLVHGIAAVHAEGTLHRDIKPPNVLVRRDGRVVLLDFGFATALRREGPHPADSTSVAGTLGYMAPEILFGKPPTEASDWYSVGVVLYETLTGKLPFDRAAALTSTRKVAPPSSVAPDVPSALDELVLALLSTAPAARPGPDAILDSLGRFAGAATSRPVTSGRAGPFVGRGKEAGLLQAAFDRLASRQPVVVQVHGSSGIGKSEFVSRFLDDLEQREEDAVVLRGRCHPQELVPYRAFDGLIDGLGRYLVEAPTSLVEAVAPRHIAELVQLFPTLERVGAFATGQVADPDAEPSELRRRGFGALRELLGRLAERRKVVLWVDDLQWGDEDSAALSRELLRAPDAPSLMFITSARSEDIGTMFDFGHLASRDDSGGRTPVVTIELKGLGADELRELIGHLVGNPESVDIDAIVSESAGSPLFVGQVVHHLEQAGPRDASPRAVRHLTLAEVLRGRVEGLPETARRLLEVVAVAGRPLERSLLLNVAGSGEHSRPIIRSLEHGHLLRSASSAGHPMVEAYHDRIREIIVSGLGRDDLRRVHRRLAETLVREPVPDAEALLRHFEGAGEMGPASTWAVRAAEHAAQTLAFARAAELYGRALALGTWDTGESARLRTEQANALVNDGRGAAAAPLYLEAAARRSGVAALDLRRRAAEQFLVSGHIVEGAGQLDSLLRDLRIRDPGSPTSTLLAIAGRVAQLRIQGSGFRARDAASTPERELIRVDTCNSAAKGLVQVQPLRGTYFSLLSLVLALRSGEVTRIGRDLCLGGSALIVAEGAIARWGHRLLARAREIAEERQDPHLLGISAITLGVVTILEGRWSEVLRLCDEGGRILRDHCRGVTWERAIGEMAAIRALEELGRIAEARERAGEMLRRAEDVGDLYAQVTARQYLAFWKIADDDPAEARRQARAALAIWTHGDYHMQHFYALRLEVCCDVYEGRVEQAWNRLAAAWPALRRTSLLRHPVVRADAQLMRCRVLVALATRGGSRAPRAARRELRRLDAEKRPDVAAHAALLRAGLVAARGEHAAARELVERAESGFERSEVALCAAYARQRRGEILGDGAGDALRAEAGERMRRATVRDPARWLLIHAPGFQIAR